MMQFRTELKTHRLNPPWDHKSQFLTLGSCFSDAIGTRLKGFKFKTLVNPFGIIYNPLSIHGLISKAIASETPAADSYVENKGIFYHYDFHSQYSSPNRVELDRMLNETLGATHAWLASTDVLMLTYGTAWVYVNSLTAREVANCHKLPAQQFSKRLINTDEIIASFRSIYHSIKRLRPSMPIVLTISPVRHIKDSLPLNSVSKSVLRVACHQLADEFSGVEYFPAYEIMMDDLRDYRFYASDMIHPSEQAEQYIWQKFVQRYISDDAQQLMEKLQGIQASLRHKPFHPTSAGHKIFLEQTLKKVEELRDFVDVDEEIQTIRRQLDQSAH